MLVSEYVLQIIEKRPYKYSTKLTNVADVKTVGYLGYGYLRDSLWNDS